MIPKFRAWKKINTQEMLNDVRAIDFDKRMIKIGYPLSRDTTRIDTESLDNVKLMQSTGLKDKNGVEIYEGDIIKNSYDEIYTVKWFDAAFYLEEKYNGGFDYHELHLEDNKKVIGNIYENPELLEG